MTMMLLISWMNGVNGCTNMLVTPGASIDNSSMIAYNADSTDLIGMLYNYPPVINDGSKKKMRQIYDWESGAYRGEIPESISTTYNVVGNSNEKGLVIAETTFGGVRILDPSHQPQGILDYGSLIWITLQRSATARQAIHTIASLLDEYGYASSGESFSIADRSGEVWIMELIGRGSDGGLGAVWVARRIPNGYISSHANQARITTFPRDDPENCLYSHDVVDLAIRLGLYHPSNDDPHHLNFSFSDTYDPITFMGARACEARVWSIFGSALVNKNNKDHSRSNAFLNKYKDYITGQNIHHRMPLWIRPSHKLSLSDVRIAMNNHYESTPILADCSADVGAGPWSSPYRKRPLLWTYHDQQYHNERTVATQQTGWNFIAHIRNSSIPELISSVLWFAVDDSSTSPRFPAYASSRRVSMAYGTTHGGGGPQDGIPSRGTTFDLNKAFWVQNMVSNFAYSRWSDIYPVVRKRIDDMQINLEDRLSHMDATIKNMLLSEQHTNNNDNTPSVLDVVTNFTVSMGDEVHSQWLQFYGELFVQFRDFSTISFDSQNTNCQCSIKDGQWSDDWKGRIVKDTGSHYKVDSDEDDGPFLRTSKESFLSQMNKMENTNRKVDVIPKWELRAFH